MNAYLAEQKIIILWIAKHKHIEENEAFLLYTRSGLAEKFSKKYKHKYDLTKQGG